MAKRRTGLAGTDSHRKSHSRKTKKRHDIKMIMLEARRNKKRK